MPSRSHNLINEEILACTQILQSPGQVVVLVALLSDSFQKVLWIIYGSWIIRYEIEINIAHSRTDLISYLVVTLQALLIDEMGSLLLINYCIALSFSFSPLNYHQMPCMAIYGLIYEAEGIVCYHNIVKIKATFTIYCSVKLKRILRFCNPDS